VIVIVVVAQVHYGCRSHPSQAVEYVEEFCVGQSRICLVA
jgi:hypothetical protein